MVKEVPFLDYLEVVEQWVPPQGHVAYNLSTLI